MVDLKIENVIAAIDLEAELDLQDIADSVQNVEYNPDVFPGLIFKLKSPKTVTLLFSKGHSVCTGADSIQNARAALTIIYKKLKDLDLPDLEKMPNITIQNLIVSYKYKDELDLKNIEKKLPSADVEYYPFKFPGLIFKDKTTEISVLMFKSGVIVGYGSPQLIDLEDLLTDLEQFYT